MKTTTVKKSDALLVLLFCLALGGMLALFLLLPKEELSLKEKRVLAAPPRLTATELLSGRCAEDAERYTADHLPGRDFLVGLDARAAQLLGRQTAGEVYLCRDGRLADALAAAKALTEASLKQDGCIAYDVSEIIIIKQIKNGNRRDGKDYKVNENNKRKALKKSLDF